MPWAVGEEEGSVSCQQDWLRQNEQSTLPQLAKAFRASRCPCADICPSTKGIYNRGCFADAAAAVLCKILKTSYTFSNAQIDMS